MTSTESLLSRRVLLQSLAAGAATVALLLMAAAKLKPGATGPWPLRA